jgi:hypothetical protein
MDRDRDRLKDVHQTDLIEGRINQDFVDWLQTKGTSYLLVILVVLVAYMGIVRWRSHREGYQTEAWTELSKAAVPSSLEDVAEKYGDVGAVAQLARLDAASKLLMAVQTGKALSPEGSGPPPDLTEADRTQYLDRADRLYAKVIESDDQSQQKTLLIATALSGRATVAECRGDVEQAKQLYEKAAQRAGPLFPKVAEQARHRAATVDQELAPVKLVTKAQLAEAQRMPLESKAADPVVIDSWARDLLMPSVAPGL